MIGKKRRYFTNYGEKLKYQCMQAVLGCTRDQRLRRKYIAQLEYWWLNIDNIILSTPAAMEAQIRIWDKKNIGQTRLLEVLSDILEDYYDTVSKKHGLKLEEMLNHKTNWNNYRIKTSIFFWSSTYNEKFNFFYQAFWGWATHSSEYDPDPMKDIVGIRCLKNDDVW